MCMGRWYRILSSSWCNIFCENMHVSENWRAMTISKQVALSMVEIFVHASHGSTTVRWLRPWKAFFLQLSVFSVSGFINDVQNYAKTDRCGDGNFDAMCVCRDCLRWSLPDTAMLCVGCANRQTFALQASAFIPVLGSCMAKPAWR